MRQRRVDRVALTAGMVLVLLGALLCLDQLDLIDLGMGPAAAALCAAAGAILVASGLAGDDGAGEDG